LEALLTSREVAAILRVSPSTLSRWRDRGEGPAWVDLGGMPRYQLDEIRSWVKDVAHERY
jgi:predicted DNA-binding transcriptional regulator AlpA